MFTDIVGSTERAARLGDARGATLVERHHAAVRRELDRHRGREIDTAGDGFFAAFDGPARAIRCAAADPRWPSASLGLDAADRRPRGECERVGVRPPRRGRSSSGARIGAYGRAGRDPRLEHGA